MNLRRDSEKIAASIIEHDARAVELIMDDIASDIGDDFVDDDTWLVNYEDYENITLLELAVRVNDPKIARYLCDSYLHDLNIFLHMMLMTNAKNIFLALLLLMIVKMYLILFQQ